MKQDILFNQLHKIISEVRFSERQVFLMGSAYNVGLVQKYLNCYNLKADAVLDNNLSLEGSYVGELRVYHAGKVLADFHNRALILVFSPGYWQEIKYQLERLGYEEKVHFYLLKDFRSLRESPGAFLRAMSEIQRGYRIYREIKKKFGENSYIFLARGATGDVFLNGLYLQPYARKKDIGSYVLAGDAKGMGRIAPLFGIERVAPLDFNEAEALQHAYAFLQLQDVKDIFTWQWSLYFNRSRIRMTERFHFQDTYTYHLYEGMVTKEEWRLPDFLCLDDTLAAKYEAMGVEKGRTIILAPFAYSVRNLPDWFWEKLAVGLRDKGYKVMVNINPGSELNPFRGIEEINFPFAEIEALLTYAGHFLALRSGLCDIAALVRCHQVILYPGKMKPVNYSVHRSDAEFSGFESMEFDSDHITEISSELIKDLANDRVESHDPFSLAREYEGLMENILKEFQALSHEPRELLFV